MKSTFLSACAFQPVDHTPVWFMRQAGRYLPEYKELRKSHTILELAQTPELAAEVTLQPLRRFDLDAAILFADIMLVPLAMGVDLDIVDSVGPVIISPIRNTNQISSLIDITPESISYLSQTIKILKKELKVPLIGFSAAPFTLASYLIEGRPSRTWEVTKHFMYTEPSLWASLMEMLTTNIIFYLSEQVRAGVDAIQLFDSWVGCLSAADFRHYVLPYSQRIFTSLSSSKLPRITFGTNTAGFLSDFADVDCEVLGVDWRTRLSATRQLFPTLALQGNLDPVVLLSNREVIVSKSKAILSEMAGQSGFIFNLGHGILPGTKPDDLKFLIDYVHTH